MEWMLMPYRRYFDFEGRSRRKELWLFSLFIMIVYSVLIVLVLAGGFSMGEAAEDVAPLSWIALALLVLFGLATIIPSLAVQVRRFHDQDRSGWFLLLNFIPYLGGLIVLVFMLMEGTRGPNRFGPDPKEGVARGV